MSDLDAEREFLERSLADLDAERAAGDLSETDYQLLKERYEARLLRSREPTPPVTASRRGKGRLARSVGICMLVGALAVGTGLVMAQFAGSRRMGQTITGNTPQAAVPDVARLEDAARLAAEGDVVGALEAYDAVLAEEPEHAAALTYKGWLLRNVGTVNDEPDLAARGVALLERASQVEPTFSEAWLFLGIVYLRDQGDAERAVDALRLALANDPIPEVEAAARELLAEIEEKT